MDDCDSRVCCGCVYFGPDADDVPICHKFMKTMLPCEGCGEWEGRSEETMERLTDYHVGEKHAYMVCSGSCRGGLCENCEELEKIIDRLASYEDTDLDPEEYKKHADAIKKLDIEHMHDLLQAEKDGRLVVMSPNTPLTPEELRNLALKGWVWIDILDASKEHGAGSAYYRKSDCYKPKEVFSCGYPGWEIMFEYADYGKTWLAYRQKPKEETHEQNKN